jgi:hypothetical protein
VCGVFVSLVFLATNDLWRFASVQASKFLCDRATSYVVCNDSDICYAVASASCTPL